jgi:sortase (surface protein transpeptidase)
MIELAEHLGMTEVVMFLKRIPQLLTFHNKTAYDNELLRRENESKENQKPISVNEPSENDEKRSRTRKRSFTKVFSRSLSRKRREENVMN